jgi:hypothetical protein
MNVSRQNLDYFSGAVQSITAPVLSGARRSYLRCRIVWSLGSDHDRVLVGMSFRGSAERHRLQASDARFSDRFLAGRAPAIAPP